MENFRGFHDLRGFHGNFVESMKTSWIPWKLRGFHGNFVDSMKTSWSPWKLRGLHENLVESMESSWIPWKLRGFHENFVETMNNSWIPWNSMGAMKIHGLHEFSQTNLWDLRTYLYNSCLHLNQVSFRKKCPKNYPRARLVLKSKKFLKFSQNIEIQSILGIYIDYLANFHKFEKHIDIYHF